MKKLTLLTIFSVFASTFAMADCAASGIFCTNKSKTLNKNGLVILEFFGGSQSIVPDLNHEYPIVLSNSTERVQLKVIEVLNGNFRLTQVVLKPVSALISNQEYTLSIEKLPTKPEFFKTTTFLINDVIDREMPIISKTPTEASKSYRAYGCGPSVHVNFNISAQDSSELFVRASVKSKRTGTTTTYILNIENGIVAVGYSMCSGPFKFDNGDKYEVTFRLLDQSGNNGVLTKSIAFTKPMKEEE
jgi:hypothetical protein